MVKSVVNHGTDRDIGDKMITRKQLFAVEEQERVVVVRARIITLAL